MIEAVMAPPNFVLVEDIEDRIPEEHLSKLSDVSWEDVHFTTFSICSSAMLEYEITSDGDLYIREDNLLEKSEYTGEIQFFTLLTLEDYDVELTFNCLFFKGELKEFELESCKELDQTPRKEAQEKIIDAVEKDTKRKATMWYKAFSVYRNIVSFIFTAVRWVLSGLIKVCWKIETNIS